MSAAVLGLLLAPAGSAQNFEFHNGFWVNLHQFLWHEAADHAADADDAGWRAAVEYYRREIIPRDPNGDAAGADDGLLSAAGNAEAPPAGLDRGLAAALTQAAPLYRRRWWNAHDRANQEWIAAARPLVAKYGDAMRRDITAAYGVDWPAAPIRVDIAAYAGAHAAYTTLNPPHITISSTDPGYRGDAALEMLFHEASHTLNGKVREALRAELEARGRLFRRRGFDHAVLFYTAGEIARRHLPGYVTYGEVQGIYVTGWPDSLPVLERDWKPYLEGRIDLQAAVRALVADYGVPK